MVKRGMSYLLYRNGIHLEYIKVVKFLILILCFVFSDNSVFYGVHNGIGQGLEKQKIGQGSASKRKSRDKTNCKMHGDDSGIWIKHKHTDVLFLCITWPIIDIREKMIGKKQTC